MSAQGGAPTSGGGAARRAFIDEVLGPSGERDLRKLPHLVVEAFSLVWQAAPRQLQLAGGLQVLTGLSLAAQLLVVRRVLDRLVDTTPGAARTALHPVPLQQWRDVEVATRWVAGTGRQGAHAHSTAPRGTVNAPISHVRSITPWPTDPAPSTPMATAFGD